MSYYDEDWKEDLIEEMIREDRFQEEEDMSNNNDDRIKDPLELMGYDKYEVEDIIDEETMGDSDDSDYVIRIKRPKRKKARNDIASMMKFANEVIKNLDLVEDESAITLDFSEVTDFSTAELAEVKLGNRRKNKDGDDKK